MVLQYQQFYDLLFYKARFQHYFGYLQVDNLPSHHSCEITVLGFKPQKKKATFPT